MHDLAFLKNTMAIIDYSYADEKKHYQEEDEKGKKNHIFKKMFRTKVETFNYLETSYERKPQKWLVFGVDKDYNLEQLNNWQDAGKGNGEGIGLEPFNFEEHAKFCYSYDDTSWIGATKNPNFITSTFFHTFKEPVSMTSKKGIKEMQYAIKGRDGQTYMASQLIAINVINMEENEGYKNFAERKNFIL